MPFRNIDIHPLLKAYVEKLWIFENEGKALTADIKLIAPNGRIKIAIPYRNAITAQVNGVSHLTKEHSITLVGFFDVPSTMDFAEDGFSGTICAELNPQGAYRFFRLQLSEIRNRHISLSDILGKIIRELEERIANTGSVEEKAAVFHQFLLQQFLKQKEDPIFEYCIDKIVTTDAGITIAELEKRTGYSSRWLNMKFSERLGVSPKNFSSIIRFKKYYEILCSGNYNKIFRNEFYHNYYDQSHFIKDFKRFTGLTPTALENTMNEFGRVFYNV